MRRKDTGNSLIKLGEGLEAILLHVQATQKMEAYSTVSNNDSDGYKNVT